MASKPTSLDLLNRSGMEGAVPDKLSLRIEGRKRPVEGDPRIMSTWCLPVILVLGAMRDVGGTSTLLGFP